MHVTARQINGSVMGRVSEKVGREIFQMLGKWLTKRALCILCSSFHHLSEVHCDSEEY